MCSTIQTIGETMATKDTKYIHKSSHTIAGKGELSKKDKDDPYIYGQQEGQLSENPSTTEIK